MPHADAHRSHVHRGHMPNSSIRHESHDGCTGTVWTRTAPVQVTHRQAAGMRIVQAQAARERSQSLGTGCAIVRNSRRHQSRLTRPQYRPSIANSTPGESSIGA